MTKRIAGAGGGRQSAPAPQQNVNVQQTVVVQSAGPERSDDANSLFSKSSIRLIDVISEGEIEGFATPDDPEQSIFFDDTPLQNTDGTDNFVYSDFASRVGTQNQNYVEGFAASENAVSVNSSVGDDVGDSVVRTITDTDVDAVIVRIAFNQIYRVDNGLKATSIGYAIDVQSDGGGYVEKVNTTVSGKCTSTYERSHRIELTGSAPWDIKLRRVSGVNDSTNNVRLMTFAGYTEIIDAKLRYPLTALVGLRFEASQFQAIPTRAYDIKGVKVQIPQNATVNTDGSLTYSGTWDGTFKVAWCADPAWILRDLLLSSRYGLGRFVANAQVDKWTLYEISKYCNASVPDGEGGNEPRFLCNVYLQSREEAYNVVQDFCSCFRGMAYWSAGQIAFTQDSPKDAAALFSNSNVIEGIFNYEGSSLKARHTVALVTWNDPDNAYQQRVEYVSDEAAISKYGIIEVRMAAFGCTSRGQANRLGRWLLYSEQEETTTCTFTVGLDGAIVRPGQIIKVADQMRAGARKGGRIASATTTELTLDQSIAVDEGDTVSVVMPDGRVEQREIDDGDFDAKTITVKTAFSTTPETQSIFVIETSTVEAQTFRVISVTEDGENYKITALEHNDSKYGFIEDGLALQPRDITTLNQKPGAPSGINVDERLVESGNRVTTEIEISWRNVDGATAYQVSFKTANNLTFFTVGDTPYNNLTFLTDETGNFTFRVVAISPLGKRSNPAELTQNIAGNTAAPAAVSGFSMIPVNGQAKLTWTQSTELDVRVGGYVRVRHSPDLSGVTWAKSTSISQDLAGSATEAYADLKTGTYLAKFVDSGGRESLTAALIEFTKPDLEDLVNVDSQQEDPTFPGSKTNLIVDTDLQELGLDQDGGQTSSAGDFELEDGFFLLAEDGTSTRNPVGNLVLEDSDELLFEGGIDTFLLEEETAPTAITNQLVLEGDATLNTSGTYLFENNPITLSDVFSIKLSSTVRARAFFPFAGRVDDIADFDDIEDFDGASPSGCDVQLFIRTTEDDPAGSPTWSSWRLFNNAEFKARAYEVKAEFTTKENNQQIAVDQLRIDSDMPSRTTRGSGTSSASADVSITYTNKFAATPVIGITAFNMATGDYYTASNSSATGFDISFYNSGGTRVVRNFDWTATGYGKG
jgi:predicted phage tail protein